MNAPLRISAALAVLLMGVTVTATPSVAATHWESIESLPGHPGVTVLVNDNPRVYFRVTPKSPLVIPVDGPAVLRVVSRAELPAGSSQVVSYHLRATENGRVLDREATETSAADRVHIKDLRGALGKSRRWSIDVPSGRHSIALDLQGAESVLLRLRTGTTGAANAKVPMVTLTPVDAPRSVNVVEGEKSIAYYTALPGKPVRYHVVGPVVLDLTSRLDFDSSMRGEQHYTVRVREGTRTIRDFDFKTTKAIAAAYSNLPDRTPSKFGRGRVQIPAGSHEILVDLLRPLRGAAEIHAAIPQPTVGGEE